MLCCTEFDDNHNFTETLGSKIIPNNQAKATVLNAKDKGLWLKCNEKRLKDEHIHGHVALATFKDKLSAVIFLGFLFLSTSQSLFSVSSFWGHMFAQRLFLLHMKHLKHMSHVMPFNLAWTSANTLVSSSVFGGGTSFLIFSFSGTWLLNALYESVNVLGSWSLFKDFWLFQFLIVDQCLF